MSLRNFIMKWMLVLVALAPARLALAQYVPIMPTVYPAFQLQKDWIGTWAEYQSTDGAVSSRQRYSLVAQGPKGYILEVHVEADILQEQLVFRFELPEGPVGAAPEGWMDVMIGRQPPIRVLIPFPPAFDGFLASKARMENAKTKTAAGTFATSHYRNENQGSSFEYWVSRDVAPLGFARSVKKLGSILSQMELSKVGRGAQPEISLPARPVDMAEFVQRVVQNFRKQK